MLFCHIISEFERFRGKMANYKGMFYSAFLRGIFDKLEFTINYFFLYTHIQN